MNLRISKNFQKKITLRTTVVIALVIIGSWLIAASAIEHFYPPNENSERGDTLVQRSGKTNDSLYQVYTRLGDNLNATKNYQKALDEYDRALKVKPNDSYVTDKISKIRLILSSQGKSSLEYTKAIASGDGYFAQKDYMNAKSAYQVALDSKPDDAYAKAKLQETLDKLRSQKAANILYDVTVASAEKLFQAKEYDKAIAEFENAAKMLPGEKYPKDRINEIIKIMVDEKTKEEMYARSITNGDKFYAAKNYQNALLEYQNANSYKPDEQYPKDRIKELTALLASMKATEEAYKKAIANADKLFGSASYSDSRAEYQNASKIKPQEIYPVNRIKEIDDILANLRKTKDQYEHLIALADSLYIGQKFVNARLSYQQALNIKPKESYPKEMIAKAEKMMTEQELSAKQADDDYLASISKADGLVTDKSYEPAKKEYQHALTLKPAEQYPKDRINEIDAILAGMEKQKSQEEQYQKLIASGDKLLADKSYESAKADYQKALQIKPAEQYPKDKIALIDAALGDVAKMKALDDQYAASVAKADKLLASKSYEPAKTEYTTASGLKPAETYPKDKIAEIDKILADVANQKAADENYQSVIANADKLFAAKSYPEAKTEYGKASDLKPTEQYPKTKIAEIDKLLGALAEQQQKDEQYTAAIARADKLLADKSYDVAKTEYTSASAIKPAETYPKTKISEIDKILEDLGKQKQLETRYQDAITSGDKLLDEKSYSAAKTQYQTALSLKPAEQYPKDKIAVIDAALADVAKMKAMDDQYAASVAKADKLLASKSYEPAKTEYTTASGLKPAESYPKEKIAEIDKVLADLAKQKATDETYQSTIANADKLFAAKSYQEAKTEYGKASDLKPTEQYPKTKIAEIDKLLGVLAEQKQKDEQYTAAIARADKLLADKSYDVAKTEYTSASAIKPAEAYPKTKISEIDKILEDLGKQKQLDERYQAAIISGDKLLDEKSYSAARTQYQTASSIKPAEQYPKDKIAVIDAALADLAKQKALDDQYTASIAKADKLLAAKSYEPAKNEYTAASGLKPSEAYPKEKIAEIDKALADLAKQKATDENYQVTIVSADKLLAAKSYPEAKTEYGKASDLKPTEQYPKTKIAEIEKILASIAEQQQKDQLFKASVDKADKLLADKSYDLAKSEYLNASSIKPAEVYPKTKVTEIDKILADIAKQKLLDDQYSSTLSDADKLLQNKSYGEAKTKYAAALALKPNEQYPKDKIAEIDKTLADLAKSKAIDDQYAASIQKADKLLADKSYDPAKIEYNNSLKIKPDEKYPKDKIAEIDKILADILAQKATDEKYHQLIVKADNLLSLKSYDPAKTEYTNALGVKPAEQYPKDKIAEIEKAIADIAHKNEIDSKYKISIVKADQLFSSKSYTQAKDEYLIAEGLNPADEYPKTKIAAIDKILGDLKAIDDQYTASISKADQLLAQKSYDPAKAEYQNASKLKPAEQYPKDKIGEIDKALAELAKQKTLDNQYQAILAKADKFLADKSYALAKTEYGNAGALKPAEQYPKDKIAEIDGVLAELKAKDDAYKASIAKANQLLAQKSYDEARTEYQNAGSLKPNEQYPKDKIAEINKLLTDIKGKKQTYDELIVKGNGYFGQKDYYKAKDTYQQAIGIFPDEAYPKERLARITNVIDSMYRANKGLYDKSIAEADKFFTNMIFDKAIDSYTDALSYLPMETYPKDMISKIKKTISENAIVDVLKTTVLIPKDVDKQFSFSPVDMASRKNNYVYVKIRNLSDKPFNVLIRYGKDKTTNGGAVIKNLAADGKTSDRLISVRDQDPWYREDNNWVSLYPQGGDVEVTFIQISRATQ